MDERPTAIGSPASGERGILLGREPTLDRSATNDLMAPGAMTVINSRRKGSLPELVGLPAAPALREQLIEDFAVVSA